MASAVALPMDISRLYQEFRLRRRRQRQRNLSAVVAAATAASDGDNETAGLMAISSSAVAVVPQQPVDDEDEINKTKPDGAANLAAFNACGNNNESLLAGGLASMVVLDPKDIKRILKQAAISGMFDLLSRHESRMQARERWLLKRLKKTLGKFELAAASAMARSLDQQRQQQHRQRDCKSPDDDLSLNNGGGFPPAEIKTSRQHHHGHRVVDSDERRRRHSGAASAASLETATCLRVPDSETACGGVHHRGSSGRFAPSGPQLVSSQSNCNNASIGGVRGCHRFVIGRDQRLRFSGAAPVARELTASCSSSSCCEVSTRTSCSVDSLTESSVEPVFSGFNLASAAPFPRFPEKKQKTQEAKKKKSNNANCNHGPLARQQRQQQQQQLQSSTPSQLIYAANNSEGCAANRPQQRQQPAQNRQQPSPSHSPPSRGIYSPARPVVTSVHQAVPGVCQCHAAVTSDDQQQPQKQPLHQCQQKQQCPQRPPRTTRKRQKSQKLQKQQAPPPRCTRCPTAPRPCPRNKKLLSTRKKKKQPGCVTEEVSCGDCKPPRISLCPVASRGRSNYSRLRLQTQPGRFITRQVLFFDGSHLYKPVQPRGPCY